MTLEQPRSNLCECDTLQPSSPCTPARELYSAALPTRSLPRADVPDCLWKLSLVRESPELPDSVEIVPPEAAAYATLGPLEEELTRRRKELLLAQATFATLSEVYSQAHRDREVTVTLLTGGSLISSALEAAVAGCRTELLTAQPGGGRAPHLLAEARERDMRLLSRGVRQRTIYQHTVRSHQATMWYIEEVTEAGAQVRTLTEVFERMIICDREVAFIPVSEERSVAALRVTHPGLVRFLAQFFENAWDRALPVAPRTSPVRPPEITSDIQRTILRAIVSGETDDSIARRLGMSRRSVAEYVRKVSLQLDSGSRAQLGYRLATSSLLSLQDDSAPAP
ncbi:helix-turn-helix domain-containing protein [Streptomyces sp. RPA4-5]|uniref:LuxR C-terminal-related transcriptional regulator n=1 Tax=Streptomyces sp. RPA4-5 TaxID=2721245 RepID=UPI00143E9819|nr:LuxR C-terminal-related transcriptional regulator [Streptomyces sp. RPA4-5]QIY58993.1 helix-turn-helix domain-containing protein [Streptomyces sp. RPA4-5]